MPIWGGSGSAFVPTIPPEEVTVDALVGADQNGHYLRMTGNGVITITLDSGLFEGWYIYIENALTGTTLTTARGAIQTSGDDFDEIGLGGTSTYPGDTRLIVYDAVNQIFRSTLLQGGQMVVEAADSGNSYVLPTASCFHDLDVFGSGGGAGAGVVVAASTACSGGGGGGGGLRRQATFASSSLGAPGANIQCVVATGGQGGQTSGANGTAGGVSNFGTFLYAYGGGAGAGAGAGRATGGGGGAGFGQNGFDASGATPGSGGATFGAGGNSSTAGGNERQGGAGGTGSANGAVGQNGGFAGFSGGGGAGGGGISAGNATFNGGGTLSIFSAVTSGNGVAPGGNATALATLPVGAPASQGGGGGASATAANGGNGANGQTPAGGGGGGGSTQTGFAAGRGGNGGDGRIVIRYG